jgi:FixJ family two-component response regulator
MERLDRRSVVAIVDDDRFVRAALSSLLRCADLEVEEFGSGEEFLAAPRDVAALVVDIRMPGISGFELSRRLASAGIHLPTIFISAVDSVQARREAAAAGARAFFPKPFAPELFIHALRSALRENEKGEAAVAASGRAVG